MATPALRAFRRLYSDAEITFLAQPFTKQTLTPCDFCDLWILHDKRKLKMIAALRREQFDVAILLKNSFSCAATVALAGIGRRIGYARDGRSWLLTDRIPVEKTGGRPKPLPMIDYYLKISDTLGPKTNNTKTELSVDDAVIPKIREKLPMLKQVSGSLVILVPGGAFGPSKLWPTQRWAELADVLARRYNATTLISVAPIEKEKAIATSICESANCNPINLGSTPLNGGELKALFSLADLVVTNDTGPRHIAIALDKPVVSLFGPNNPKWTETPCAKEIKIIGRAPCVPCDKPVCRMPRHLCMESITVSEVLDAAAQFLASEPA